MLIKFCSLPPPAGEPMHVTSLHCTQTFTDFPRLVSDLWYDEHDGVNYGISMKGHALELAGQIKDENHCCTALHL